MTSLSISLQLPDRRLRPNWKAGTRGAMLGRARKVREYRNLARVLTLHKLGPLRPKWEHATVLYTFHFKSNRYMLDPDNCIGAMKAALDGMVDAGLLHDDNHIVIISPLRLVDAKHTRVVVLVERTS